MVSDAQKRASNKYNAAHYQVVGCKVTKEQASVFKEYCSSAGKTANAVLHDFVLKCIENYEIRSVDIVASDNVD